MDKSTKRIYIRPQGEPDEYTVFEDDFHCLASGRVLLRISICGDYNLYINGELVSFGQYADYPHYSVYDELDITAYVRAGENYLRIVCWYVGESFSTAFKGSAGLMYEVQDAGEILCQSKAGVRCALATDYVSYQRKIITPQLGYSYCYNLGGMPEIWVRAVEVSPLPALFPRPNRKLKLLPPVEAKPVPDKKNIYDLGKERCGFLYICLKAELGKKVRIAYGEHLEDGSVRHKIGVRDFTVELIGNGKKATFFGAFRRLGCRYLEVLDEAEIVFIGIAETDYPFEEIPYKITNDLQRQIYATSLATLKLCYHEHYEDCPWREQAMYLMDTRTQMRAGYKAFLNRENMRSALTLFENGQKENGLFELCFPAEVPITIPCFSLMFPVILWEYFENTGDIGAVEEGFPAAQKAVNYFTSRLENRLYKTVTREGIWNFYEWAEGLDDEFFSHEGKREKDEFDSLINSFLAIALASMQKLCCILHKECEEYALLREQITAAIYNTFYDSEKGMFLTRTGTEEYSALANALCVLADACSPEEQKIVCEKLASEDTKWVENTLSMEPFRYDALLKVDFERYKDVVIARIDKTYSYMLERGATSFWETIKGASDFDGAGSLCHGWSAAPVYYYRLLGIAEGN